ncbi:MAG TPA: AMP-binding protein [Streptosporangiaceae bacterium]|nr:AMP-binding protein [Streptosporangiaceae bacterium]
MNIASLLRSTARMYPDRGFRYGETRITYAEVEAQAASLGSALRRRGLQRGDRVALFARNCPEFVVAMFGALRAGLIIVPINAKLVAGELEVILRDSGARALIATDDKAAVVDSLGTAVPETVIWIGGRREGSFESLLGEGDTTAAVVDVDPGDTAWLFYTSGTTGQPKGAGLSHRALMAMTLAELANLCDFTADDTVLHVAPLSHGSGLYLLGVVARGSEQVIFNGTSYDPDAVLAQIERDRITVIAFLAPTMITMLLDAPRSADTSSLRCVIYGGGPIHVATSKRMLERFGPVFAQIYGMGESPMTITYLPRTAHDLADPESLASAGYCQLGVEVQVMDENDRPLPPGVEGMVCVRGDVVMSGYWNNPAASAGTLRGGWLHTGDIGRFDARGRLFLLDRSNDTIISGGANIYPREVEEVLMRHPGVCEAVVFGVPDELWGESVAAAVVAAPGEPPAKEDLVDFCRSRLASFKKPKQIVFVDELPKNAYGKVLRRVVRDKVIALVP